MRSHLKEEVDRQIGMWSSQLADELHKPVRKRFQKRSVFAKQVDEQIPSHCD